MAAAPILTGAFVDLMENDESFATILEQFGLAVRAKERFLQEFPNARSPLKRRVKVNNQNKTFRTHPTPNQRCYVTATQQNRSMAFHRWALFAIKDGHARYGVDTLAEFTREWIDSIREEYSNKDPEITSQSTAFSVDVPKFTGTNWFDVRSKIYDLLRTRIGASGLPLTYLIRAVRRDWEDTEEI